MRVLLNPAPAAEGLNREIDLSDIEVITPNRGELTALTGIDADTDDGLRRALARLRAMGPKTVVVTLGAEGCFVDSAEASRRLPARRVRAVDAVGAGDAFNGAASHRRRGGRSRSCESVRTMASGPRAALAVTRPGAQTAMPMREEIDRFASAPIV